LRVSELPINERLKQLLESEGVKELFPPQTEACKRGLFSGRNIIMSTQTASGKTLIAEIACINNVLSGRGKSAYLTPLKALAMEKLADFKRYEVLGVKTALSIGDYDSSDPYLHEYDVVVSTYEKMDSLLRHKPRWFSQVSLIVIDEIHYVDDPERGPVLESLISKVKAQRRDIQIVGLSATIGNPEELARWLDAELVVSEWRPVPLREGVYFKNRIVYSDGAVKLVTPVYSHPIYDLILDVLAEGGQALVFVNSRRRAVELAEAASRRMGSAASRELVELAEAALESSEVPDLNKRLYETLKRGYGFHHAGLTLEQRRIVEDGFRKGLLRAVFATPTLAAGVNLPARRVIVEDLRRYNPIEGNNPIKVLEYKQFAGRAGRPGYDPYGEAIVVVRREHDVDWTLNTYMLGKPEAISSKLNSPRALRSHILAYIASDGPVKAADLKEFLDNSLYAIQKSRESLRDSLNRVLDFLTQNGFVREQSERVYEATRLGKRVSEVYVDPLSALILLKAVSRRKKPSPFALIHLIAMTPDMPKLSFRRKEIELIERVLNEFYHELLIYPEERGDIDYELLLSETKTAMLLYDWISEESEQAITEKYDVGPGDIRSLVETAEWIAYAFKRIVELLPEARTFHTSFSVLEKRLRYGVREELLELVSIPGVGRVRARKLYRAGFRSLEELASASIWELSRIEGIGEKLARSIVEFSRKNLGRIQVG